MLHSLSILVTRFWFYPRPLRQSGKQGAARIVKPVHQRKLRSFLNLGQFLTGLSIFDIRTATGLFYSAGIRLCQTTSLVPGDCLWPLSCRAHFPQTAGLSCLLQRRCNQTQSTPVLGHVGLRWVVPVPGIPALPLTRHCQVVRGLCPMTVSRKRTCQLWLSGGQKH